MKKLSRLGIAAAVFPSMLILIAFYSMAIHLYVSLGGWPNSIGTRGFSEALKTHASFQYHVVGLGIPIFGGIAIAGLIIFSIPKKTRRLLPYFGIHLLCLLICFGLMALAPDRYWEWWLD